MCFFVLFQEPPSRMRTTRAVNASAGSTPTFEPESETNGGFTFTGWPNWSAKGRGGSACYVPNWAFTLS
eukprot:5385715-Pleurochrysis_carterae.AAC.1